MRHHPARRGLAAPPRSPDSMVARAFPFRVAGLEGGGQQQRPNLVDLQQPGGDELAEVEGGPVQGCIAAAGRGSATAARSPASAAGP